MNKLMFLFLITSSMIFSHANVTAQRSIEPFDEIRVSGNVELNLVQSGEESILIDNNEDDLKVEVNAGLLKLRRKELWNTRQHKNPPIIITVTYRKLRSLHAAAGSNVRHEDMYKGDELELDFHSGAYGTLSLETDAVDARVGEGANLKLKGKTNSLHASAATGANLRATDLDCNHSYAKASTGGVMHIVANSSLEASATLGGTISYIGKPERLEVKESLGGSVN